VRSKRYAKKKLSQVGWDQKKMDLQAKDAEVRVEKKKKRFQHAQDSFLCLERESLD